MRYRNVGNVPKEVEKGDKRVMLGPTEFVELSKDELEVESNAALVEDGFLIEAPEKGK